MRNFKYKGLHDDMIRSVLVILLTLITTTTLSAGKFTKLNHYANFLGRRQGFYGRLAAMATSRLASTNGDL